MQVKGFLILFLQTEKVTKRFTVNAPHPADKTGNFSTSLRSNMKNFLPHFGAGCKRC